MSAADEMALRRLQAALRFKRLAPVLGIGAFVIPAGTVGLILAVMALVFTPYVCVQLARARWWAALVTFGLAVILPTALLWIWHPDTNVGVLARYTAPLVLFYLYVWGLYLAVESRLADRERARQFGFGE